MVYEPLKDNANEQRVIHLRLLMALLLVILLMVILLSRFYFLQIIEHEKYNTRSVSNRVFLQRIPPSRGLIFDRNHELLAENQPGFLMAIVPDKVTDLSATLSYLKSLKLIDDENIAMFRKRLKRHRMFEQIPIRLNLTDKDIAVLVANRPRLNGVEIKADLLRHYPYGAIMVHMLGYVGRINDREQRVLDSNNYAGTHHVGKIGVEKYYENVLHGKVGYENVETNAQGRVLRVLKRVNPQKGKDLTLFLDARLQKVAYDALAGRRGAVVAIDTHNGGILAAVSRPGYDPSHFVNGISYHDYDLLKNDPDMPLFNRVMQAQYPPGSVIKPVISIAGLDEGVITANTTINDPGWYKLPNDDHLFRDWKRSGHGKNINLKRALEESCDVYYYDLAFKLGIHSINKYYDMFGIGHKTGIDVPGERRGVNPTPKWKRSQGRSSWYTGDSLNISIGQGFLLATPLQLANIATILANKGIRHVPQMVASIGGEPVPTKTLPPIILKNPKFWDDIRYGMEAVVHGRKGTARRMGRGLKYRMAGKSATAQVVGIAQGERYDAKALKERQRDHALFFGFAPSNNPSIAVAVIVENGGSGGAVAGPVARKVFDAWINKESEGGSNASK